MQWEVESQRLGMRRFVDDDAPALAAVIADPMVARTITANVSTEAKQLEVARQRIGWHNKFWESDGLGVWAVSAKDSPERIMGWAGFIPAHIGDDAEILYGIGRPNWGQGYASEAALVVTDWLWANTDRPGICASVFAGNPASERIATKLGMERVADLPIAQFADGPEEIEDVISYDLWRLESAADASTGDEIGHRIGQMTGAMLEPASVWERVIDHLSDPTLETSVRAGFERGLSNPAIMFFRADRP